MNDDWQKWANRRNGRAGNVPADPGGNRMAPAPQPQAPTLPPAPPGYAWAAHPQAGFILVPLNAPAAPQGPPGWQAPQYQQAPQYAPQAQPQVAYRAPRSIETNALVKPGPEDYARFMAGVPDLMPDSGYDSMAGNPHPLVAQELANLPEYQDRSGAVHPDTPTRAFQRPVLAGSQVLPPSSGEPSN